MCKVLLVGEQNTETRLVVEGFDSLTYVRASQSDFGPLLEALSKGGHEVSVIPTGDVQEKFPETQGELHAYEVILISDVGSNSFLLHPEVLTKSIRHPNRLKLLRDYVAAGGGLVMVGGWISFTGIGGKAKYHGTFLEEALPVTCLPYDDRVEAPDGVTPQIIEITHPIFNGVDSNWPFFLGYNRVISKLEASTLLRIRDDPLLSVWEFGDGRAAAFTSDCAPHWAPPEFQNWIGFSVFWNNLIDWLAKSEESPGI